MSRVSRTFLPRFLSVADPHFPVAGVFSFLPPWALPTATGNSLAQDMPFPSSHKAARPSLAAVWDKFEALGFDHIAGLFIFLHNPIFSMSHLTSDENFPEVARVLQRKKPVPETVRNWLTGLWRSTSLTICHGQAEDLGKPVGQFQSEPDSLRTREPTVQVTEKTGRKPSVPPWRAI